MRKEIKFRKGRRGKILLGIIFFALFLILSFSFLLNSDIYIRNIFMTGKGIQVIGIIGIIYYSSLLYSFFKISLRKHAILITEDFLIDNSKYESLGKIKWRDISKIQRFKKNNIELFLNTNAFKSEKSNLLKRILRFMHNWNYKKSILISNSLLDCSIEELFEIISVAHEKYKLK